ncbi:uncharacterized protein ACIQIH_018355 isoform 1-T1 [Cyanocitta cristata]
MGIIISGSLSISLYGHLQLRRKGIIVSTLPSLHIWWKDFSEPSASSCPIWKVAWGIFGFMIYDLISPSPRKAVSRATVFRKELETTQLQGLEACSQDHKSQRVWKRDYNISSPLLPGSAEGRDPCNWY